MTSAMLDRVDQARAEFRGITLVGHRKSLLLGQMAWAIPGGTCATTWELSETGLFEKISGPTDKEIKAYVNNFATLPKAEP